MRQYTVLVFFFLAYFTLYNRLQFRPPHFLVFFLQTFFLPFPLTEGPCLLSSAFPSLRESSIHSEHVLFSYHSTDSYSDTFSPCIMTVPQYQNLPMYSDISHSCAVPSFSIYYELKSLLPKSDIFLPYCSLCNSFFSLSEII